MTASNSTSILWFRRDLRLQDNPALDWVCENSDAVLPITSDADFYNTQYGFYKISDDTYDWGNNSASTYKVFEELPFNQGFYPMVINNTSIKQNVNFPSSVVDGVPTDNGGGHATISKLNKFSGGWIR